MQTWALNLVVVSLLIGSAAAQDPMAAARKAMNADKPAEALALLEENYETVSKTPAGLQLLAESALKAGRYGRAMDYSVKLVDMKPELADGHKLGAQAFYWKAEEAKNDPAATGGRIKGFYEESKVMNEAYLKLNPKDVEMWSLLGHTGYWIEEHAVSISAFGKASELDPKNPDYLLNLARAQSLQKNHGLAQTTLQKAVAIAPDRADVKLKVADSFAQAGDLDKAGEWCVKGLKSKNLESATANKLAMNIYQILKGKKGWDQGAQWMQEWADVHRDSADAMWWKGYYLSLKPDIEGSKSAYESAWKRSRQTQASSATKIAELCMRQAFGSGSAIDVKRAREGVEWYLKAHAIPWNWGTDPNNRPIAKINGAFIYLANNNHLKEGVEILEKVVLPKVKDDYSVYNNLGLYYRDLGGRTRGSQGKTLCVKSKDYYVKAAELVVNDPFAKPKDKAQVLNDTGLLFHFPQYQIKDMETGIKYYTQALTHDASFVDANENMGLCMNALGKFEEAKTYFQKVLDQEPRRPVSRRGMRDAEKGGN